MSPDVVRILPVPYVIVTRALCILRLVSLNILSRAEYLQRYKTPSIPYTHVPEINLVLSNTYCSTKHNAYFPAVTEIDLHSMKVSTVQFKLH